MKYLRAATLSCVDDIYAIIFSFKPYYTAVNIIIIIIIIIISTIIILNIIAIIISTIIILNIIAIVVVAVIIAYHYVAFKMKCVNSRNYLVKEFKLEFS